jgi:hypothetical protein
MDTSKITRSYEGDYLKWRSCFGFSHRLPVNNPVSDSDFYEIDYLNNDYSEKLFREAGS